MPETELLSLLCVGGIYICVYVCVRGVGGVSIVASTRPVRLRNGLELCLVGWGLPPALPCAAFALRRAFCDIFSTPPPWVDAVVAVTLRSHRRAAPNDAVLSLILANSVPLPAHWST